MVGQRSDVLLYVPKKCKIPEIFLVLDVIDFFEIIAFSNPARMRSR
jgi:hypothetical protein